MGTKIIRVPKDTKLPLRFYQAYVELPRDDKTNERRRILKRSKDKALLSQWKTDTERALLLNGDVSTDTTTTAEWFTYWLSYVAPKEIRPKALNNYESMLRTHATPIIGRVPLTKLTAAHIRKVNNHVGSIRSSSTARSVHAIMSSSLNDAVREERIPRNPAKLVRPPKRSALNLEVLTTAESRQLLKHYAGTPEGYLWVTVLLSCARRGEVIGLEWGRVTDELDLSWQLQTYTKGTFTPPADYEYRQLTETRYLTRPKSTAGVRVVPLVDPLRGILAAWRAIAPVNPYGLVFATQNGEPLDPDRVSKMWPAALKAAGIDKKVRLHDLRHSGVDLLYEAGVPETIIMELVGHSTRAMTRGYKSRGNRPQLIDAMTKVGELVSGIQPHQ